MGWSKEDREYDKMQEGFYVTGIERRIKKLEAENARLREALKVYADLEYWGAVQGDDQEYLFRESIGQKTYVQGKRARDALEGKE